MQCANSLTSKKERARERDSVWERKRERGRSPRSQEISERILFFEIISFARHLADELVSLCQLPSAVCSCSCSCSASPSPPLSCLIFRPLRTQSEITHESCWGCQTRPGESRDGGTTASLGQCPRYGRVFALALAVRIASNYLLNTRKSIRTLSDPTKIPAPISHPPSLGTQRIPISLQIANHDIWLTSLIMRKIPTDQNS